MSSTDSNSTMEVLWVKSLADIKDLTIEDLVKKTVRVDAGVGGSKEMATLRQALCRARKRAVTGLNPFFKKNDSQFMREQGRFRAEKCRRKKGAVVRSKRVFRKAKVVEVEEVVEVVEVRRKLRIFEQPHIVETVVEEESEENELEKNVRSMPDGCFLSMKENFCPGVQVRRGECEYSSAFCSGEHLDYALLNCHLCRLVHKVCAAALKKRFPDVRFPLPRISQAALLFESYMLHP